MFCPALIVKIILKKGPLNGYISFLTQNIFLNPFYTFGTWGNFKQLSNAEHLKLKSTHPTVQCTQDIGEVHTDTI